MSELFEYLVGRLPITTYKEPMDLYDYFVDQWNSRHSGSTMPPSPGARTYAMQYELTDEGFHYEVEIDWSPFVYELVKLIEPWQITHRSRAIAVAYSQGRITELNHRIMQTRKYYPKLVVNKVSARESEEMYLSLMDHTLEHLHINKVWIKKYIDEHRTSSLGLGHKWNQAYTMDDYEIKEIYNLVKGNIELLRSHPGEYTHIDYLTGIRARSEGLPGFRPRYSISFTRARIITFDPRVSLWTWFIPEKASWYSKFLTDAMEILDVEGEYIFPYMIGGRIYREASNNFVANKRFTAYDGKSHESSIGVLLGDAFKPLWMYVQDIPMLGSGATYTSATGTLGAIVETRNVGGIKLILGDDINIWDGKNLPKVPYVEYQPEDTKHKFILGTAFDPDPVRPRISGIKASADRGKEMRPIALLPGEERYKLERYGTYGQAEIAFNTVVEGKSRDSRTRAAWGGMFLGQYGNRSLLESIESIPPGEYVSPSYLIEKLIEQELPTDPFVWAEERGIKNVWV